MRKNFFKKAIAIMSVTTLLLGMSTNVYAAEDDVEIASMERKYGDSATDVADTWYDWHTFGDVTGYKYLQIKYKGDDAAFQTMRLLFKSVTTSGEVDLGWGWMSENQQGTLKQADGSLAPAATATEQTVIFDLSKTLSAENMAKVLSGVHIHVDKAKGSFEITDAKLMKALPEDDKKEDDKKEDDKKEENNNTNNNNTNNNNSTNGGKEETGDATAITAMIATLVGCAAVVAVASRKKANAAE